MTQALTFEDVAKDIGLNEQTTARYVAYMRARWALTEADKCRDGYAEEWARRFEAGVEYSASDAVGQVILRQIDKRG